MYSIHHVSLATRDFANTALWLEDLGLAAVQGYRFPHVGWSNLVVPVSTETHQYIEVLGVTDPDQAARHPYGGAIDALTARGDRFVAWALLADDVDAVGKRIGVKPDMWSAVSPDGETVNWKLVGIIQSWSEPTSTRASTRRSPRRRTPSTPRGSPGSTSKATRSVCAIGWAAKRLPCGSPKALHSCARSGSGPPRARRSRSRRSARGTERPFRHVGAGRLLVMSQGHMDRLTAVDASFLVQEGPVSHMHVGGVSVFEGPPPPFEEFLEQLRGRLHLVPRYRQKLANPPLNTGRPLWVDDPNFNLEYHVRQTALPSPGSEEQLLLLTSRIFSQQLDRSKPLWETWLVEGLEGNRFALISKTHHALIDGIAGVDLATVMFDLSPVPPEIENTGQPWQPQPEPGAADLVATGLKGLVRTGIDVATRAAGALTRPDYTLRTAREAAEGVGEIVWATLNPAPSTPLNVEIGPHRRFVGVPMRLDDFKRVKNAFGGTVNDVVLTIVSGALRSFLHSRGVKTEGLELRALVPVSIRPEQERGQLGNRIAVMRGPLPVYIADPIERLRTVKRAMDGLKESKQAVGAEVIAGAQNFAPPTILAQASRLNFSTRLFNLIVTNVPGPQFPLYLQGRELQEIYPVAFLPKDHGLAIAIISYNGSMNFGLLGDYDALPDIESFGDWLRDSINELLDLVPPDDGAHAAKASNGRAAAVTPSA
jgi:diacylglycerol O-acyltransferase / wax synthase